MNQAQQATNRATSQIEKGLSKVDSAFKKVAKAAATYISVKALVSFGKECVELGSDLSEVQNVVDTTFGSMSNSVNAFAKNAITQFGLSETAAKKYSSTMGAMLKSMGLNQQQTLSMSTTLAGLAGDMASFYNISTDEAFAKIRSGISGETEPLKQLGINLSVANLEAYALSQGITKSYNSMTQAEQAILRYNYLLKSTSDAQGDFSKTSGSWANQVRILTENFNSLKATLGQGLIMALTPVIKLINSLLEGLQSLANKFKYLMAVITGQDLNEVFGTGTSGEEASENLADDMGAVSGYADSTSDSVEDIADGMKDAAKQAKAFLFSFDEIHKLESNDDKKSTEDEDKITSLIDMSSLSDLDVASDAVNEFKDNLPLSEEQQNALREQFQPIIDLWENEIQPRIQKIGDKLGDLYDNHLKGLFENVGDLAKTLWHNVLSPFIKWVVDEAIPAIIDLVGHLSDAVSGAARTGNGVIKALTATTVEEKEEAGFDIVKGIDDTLKSVGGFMFGWIPEKIFGVKDAQKTFNENWEQKSAMQNASDFLHLDSSQNGFNLWQYVTPEIEKMIDQNGGHFNEEIVTKMLNDQFNPWNDLDYAQHYYSQIGDEKALEAIQALQETIGSWKELEGVEHQNEVYGEVAPTATTTDIQPVEDRLTKQDLTDAMDRMIEVLSAERESDVVIDGVVAGTQFIRAYLANNMTKNPEVQVV